jgi:type I restriction enzyme S subunit
LLEKTVYIPKELPEQTAIAAVLSDMDAELETLETKLDKARQVKQGMMQQLLTGKVRLVGSQPHKAEVPLPVAAETTTSTAHNQPFNEAVLISVLAGRYGKRDFPLSRFRYTKFLYLFHRRVDHVAQGFRKKAAGPYNPDNRYKGPEAIAQNNKYMIRSGNGFVTGPKNVVAFGYYEKWYPIEHLKWLDAFKFEKSDALEVLTTVDMACEDLKRQGKVVSVQSVKALIASEPEWLPKLSRAIFSDTGIAAAIRRSEELFGEAS